VRAHLLAVVDDLLGPTHAGTQKFGEAAKR
jgi:hypothetical protein